MEVKVSVWGVERGRGWKRAGWSVEGGQWRIIRRYKTDKQRNVNGKR